MSVSVSTNGFHATCTALAPRLTGDDQIVRSLPLRRDWSIITLKQALAELRDVPQFGESILKRLGEGKAIGGVDDGVAYQLASTWSPHPERAEWLAEYWERTHGAYLARRRRTENGGAA